ncbi:hypothetical protein MTO96_037903, partial [Rhipicephalus appendiculatus]
VTVLLTVREASFTRSRHLILRVPTGSA